MKNTYKKLNKRHRKGHKEYGHIKGRTRREEITKIRERTGNMVEDTTQTLKVVESFYIDFYEPKLPKEMAKTQDSDKIKRITNSEEMPEILLASFVIVSINNAICEESDSKTETASPKVEEEELIQSESKDGKLEIIKRIKKVNPDGSYTIGYEADDGSFKIESRDVLGNIKGTYGFVDDEGDIKRVSYSSSNASDAFSKHEPVSTPAFPAQPPVQKVTKIVSSLTTSKPSTYPTSTPVTPTTISNSVIQSIARRRASSTTLKPNYNNIENIKSTARGNSVTYTSAAPRVLLQRPSLTSTASTKEHPHKSKSEGQISRPDFSDKPTERPIYRNLQPGKFEDEKPVTEEASEIRTNILRRQLPQNSRESSFNAEEHVYNFQQSLGHNDISDVYNNGVTVGSRPLFTTTRPNRILPLISSRAASPVAVIRSTANYAARYQSNQLQGDETNTATNSQPPEEIATSTEPASTSTNLPVVQIPANRPATPEPLVAIRHPFQQGAILVPLSQWQNRVIPVENMQDVYDARRYYVTQQHQNPYQLTTRPPLVEIEKLKMKRLNLPALRPLPVQVDENGFIRGMPQHIPTPYPIPVPVIQVPGRSNPDFPAHLKQVNNDITNDIESIQPPVSTKDFQTLLNQLIIRQKKLERISALTSPKLYPEIYQPQPERHQRTRSATPPYFIQRIVSQRPDYEQQDQEVYQPQQRESSRQYVTVKPHTAESGRMYAYQYSEGSEGPKKGASTYERRPAYLVNRRTARLLPVRSSRQNQVDPEYSTEESETQAEEYLPPDVREMLLLRMLQLAMNPALPLDDDDEHQQVATITMPQYRRLPVRNVEILGEEEDENEVRKKRPLTRAKRYKEEDMEYME